MTTYLIMAKVEGVDDVFLRTESRAFTTVFSVHNIALNQNTEWVVAYWFDGDDFGTVAHYERPALRHEVRSA